MENADLAMRFSAAVRFWTLVAAGVAGWLVIWGFFRAVDTQNPGATWYWAETDGVQWMQLVIWLTVPLLVGLVWAFATRGNVSLLSSAAFAAAFIAFYAGARISSQLSEGYTGDPLATFLQRALGVGAMGMLAPIVVSRHLPRRGSTET